MKKKQNIKIMVVSTNEEKPGTCGSCFYTDNDLGLAALHCTCKKKEAVEVHMDDYGKTRSWHKCKHWRKR